MFDVRALFKSESEARVRETVLTSSSIDSADPVTTYNSLLDLPISVHVLSSLVHCSKCNSKHILSTAGETLGHAHYFLSAPIRHFNNYKYTY